MTRQPRLDALGALHHVMGRGIKSKRVTQPFKPFIERVTTGAIRVEKRRRLEAIWEKAGETIGCDSVPGVDHEAKVMVEGLRHVRSIIGETDNKIEGLCH